MSADNVCAILEHAVRFDHKELFVLCMKFVNEYSKAVFESDVFVSVSHKVLQLIVEHASTSVALDIYEACKTWAKSQIEQQGGNISGEKIRKILCGITSKIKFSAMSYEDFLDIVAQDHILNDSEVVNNVLGIREKQKEKEPNPIFIRRAQTVVKIWNHEGKQDGISFTVSTNVWLTAVDLFLPTNNGGKLTGPLEVFEEQTQVFTTNVTLIGQTGKQFESYKLPTRVRLQSGKVYSLRQRLEGDNSYRASKCSTVVSADNVYVTFRTLSVGSSDNGTGCSSGQFYGITLIKV